MGFFTPIKSFHPEALVEASEKNSSGNFKRNVWYFSSCDYSDDNNSSSENDFNEDDTSNNDGNVGNDDNDSDENDNDTNGNNTDNTDDNITDDENTDNNNSDSSSDQNDVDTDENTTDCNLVKEVGYTIPNYFSKVVFDENNGIEFFFDEAEAVSWCEQRSECKSILRTLNNNWYPYFPIKEFNKNNWIHDGNPQNQIIHWSGCGEVEDNSETSHDSDCLDKKIGYKMTSLWRDILVSESGHIMWFAEEEAALKWCESNQDCKHVHQTLNSGWYPLFATGPSDESEWEITDDENEIIWSWDCNKSHASELSLTKNDGPKKLTIIGPEPKFPTNELNESDKL